jgi:hypothetical protein
MFNQIRSQMNENGMAQNVDLEPMLDLMSGSVISEANDESNPGNPGKHPGPIARFNAMASAFSPIFEHFSPNDRAMGELYAFFDRQIESKLNEMKDEKKGNEEKEIDEEEDFVKEFLREMERRSMENGKENYFTLVSIIIIISFLTIFNRIDALRSLCFEIFVAGQVNIITKFLLD